MNGPCQFRSESHLVWYYTQLMHQLPCSAFMCQLSTHPQEFKTVFPLYFNFAFLLLFLSSVQRLPGSDAGLAVGVQLLLFSRCSSNCRCSCVFKSELHFVIYHGVNFLLLLLVSSSCLNKFGSQLISMVPRTVYHYLLWGGTRFTLLEIGTPRLSTEQKVCEG